MMGAGTRPSTSAAACWRSISTSCSSRASGERAGVVSSRPPSVTLGIMEGASTMAAGSAPLLGPAEPAPGSGRRALGSNISSASAMRGWGEGERPLADARRTWPASWGRGGAGARGWPALVSRGWSSTQGAGSGWCRQSLRLRRRQPRTHLCVPVRADAALLALRRHAGRRPAHHEVVLVCARIRELARPAGGSQRGPAQLPCGSRLGCANWLHAWLLMLRPAP
jgi:hypothetical protein